MILSKNVEPDGKYLIVLLDREVTQRLTAHAATRTVSNSNQTKEKTLSEDARVDTPRADPPKPAH
jgi:hypothetical protein